MVRMAVFFFPDTLALYELSEDQETWTKIEQRTVQNVRGYVQLPEEWGSVSTINLGISAHPMKPGMAVPAEHG